MAGRQKSYLEGAILAVDAVGYSRLMGKDEEATLRRLHTYRGLIQTLATTHSGRVFGVAGDSEMAIFAEAGDAVRCALEIQEEIGERDALLPKDSQMPVRIGINYGDVIVEDDSFFGDDVNIAARIESFAEAGEVCISGTVFDRIREANAWGFDSFGEERFKNIAHPVRVYRVRTDADSLGQVIPAKRRRPKPGRIWRMAAAASLIALLGATGWGVKVQIEKRRAEVEAATVISEAQSSVAAAEAQIVQLLGNLRQSEKRATDERERVEGLLASLQDIRSRADRNEQAALEEADEAEDLLALLQASEARATAEEERVQTLLTALREAESQVTAAREAAEQERQARQDAERRAADQALMESLLASWRAAEQRAAEERARTEALLAALQDTQARAEAERQAKLEQQRSEGLLARLNEAHGLAVRERRRAEDLYAQVQDARDKAANHEGVAQQLDAEAGRIEALLDTLQEAETRVAAERDRVEDMLESLRRADPAPPQDIPEGEPEDNGGAWQDANSLERAEVLLATWTEAEREATDERERAEDLLAALETLPQPERAPPPVPPPKPELRSAPEEPGSEGVPSPEPDSGPAPGGEQSEALGPEAVQLAYNPVDETQALPPRESLAPVMPDAEGDTNTENPWNGTWTGNNGTWSAELTIADGKFQLEAFCDAPRAIRESVSGSIDETGRISAVLRQGRGFAMFIFGTPEALDFDSGLYGCQQGDTLKLEREDSEPTVALATQEGSETTLPPSPAPVDLELLEGNWTGEQDVWSLELTIEDREFTLFAKCLGGGYVFHDTATGTLDDKGHIYAKVRENYISAVIWGPPERLEILPHWKHCSTHTVVELQREGSEPTVALATEPSFNHFDGKWVGKAVAVQSGPRCAVTSAIEITVSGRDFTGFSSEGHRWSGYMRQFSGTVDGSGEFVSKGRGFRNNYHGTLLADLGKGSGEWMKGECNGTFELTRVEDHSPPNGGATTAAKPVSPTEPEASGSSDELLQPLTAYDGKWVGKAVALHTNSSCNAMFAMEIMVGGRDFTGLADKAVGLGWALGQFSGSVDASGAFVSKGPGMFRGTLLSESGTGVGEWATSGGACNGTFELSRVEQLSG